MENKYWGYIFASRDLHICRQNTLPSITDLQTFWHSHEPNAGSHIDIYVVDTGILKSHTEFTSDSKIEILFDPFNKGGVDEIGHGTALTSLICGKELGISPSATVHVLKVFELQKTTSQDQLVDALKCVLHHHIEKRKQLSKSKSILNLSLATVASKELISIIEQLSLADILVIIANDNQDRHDFIFELENNRSVITVGALKQNLQPLNTNISEIYAPGENIFVATKKDNQSYSLLSGNSIAAGFTTGIAASLWSKVLSFDAAEIKQHLLETCENRNGIKMIKRLNETFEPRWSTSETGIIEALKPNLPVIRKLRCINPSKGPLHFKIIAGFLPNGLSLSDDGIISGIPVLDEAAKQDHLNYFSTIIRAENDESYVDRNISIVVTNNFNKIQLNETIIAPVQLAKCNGGTDTLMYMNTADNQGAPGQDAPSGFGDSNFFYSGGDCCFTASSRVHMADGCVKNISDVLAGDFVLQKEGVAKVVAVVALPLVENRKVYRINDLPIYLTEEHPLYGYDDTIFAIDPAQKNKADSVKPLRIGTLLKTKTGKIEVLKIEAIATVPNQPLYHLYVEGDGSYYVGDILTYKKHDGIIFSFNTESAVKPHFFEGAV